jgi:PAS domain S-box-containing protein
MPLRHLPIQRKLVGFIFLITLTVLLGSNLALFVYESRISKQTTTQSLKTLADIIASNSTAALIYDDPQLAEEIISGLRAEPDVRAAALFDKQGRIYASYPSELPFSAFPKTPQPDGARFSFRELILFQPVIQGNNRVGTLYLRSDLGGMYRRLRVYFSVLIGVLLGSVLLAFFLSNFLQRQISQPIINLAETAKMVSEEKDYSVRAEKRSGDELGFVTEAFNSMLEQIQLNHAALGESEERFRVVADSAPVLIWIAGPDMLATWFNKYWLDFVGRTMAQEVGEGWIENLHSEDRSHSREIYAAALGQRQYFRLECRLRRSDGSYRWLLNQGTPRYQGDDFVGFIGSCVDINDNKEAEAIVRLSELQMRLITDNASVFLCQIDREHRFKFVNRAYARRFGMEPTEVVGRHVADILGVEAYEMVRGKIDMALTGIRQEYELELPYATLGVKWTHAIYEPEIGEGGEVEGIVSVLTDVTERRQVAKDLERARDEAVNASRAKDDFLAALSHELRTPLNPVLLLATAAVNDHGLSPEVRADFDTVRKNVELEARLIDDLLDLTRITNGKMVMEQLPVDIHDVMRDSLATIQNELASRRIELVLNFSPGSPKVRGDAVRLQQVFWNVFKNAVKFTPEEGKVSIVTAVSRERETVSIKVSDTGIGMSSGELEHIFEAFSQGDHAKGIGSHRFGGLGLGLAISRKVIELHSGRISAASGGRNLGSIFSIDLPLMLSVDEGMGRASAPPDANSGLTAAPAIELAGSRRSILLIEDHSPTRLALSRLLQRRNYRVLSGASIEEARAIVEREKIDFVISDIGLPDGSGYDLMSELEERFHLKGIALTGYGMESDIARSRATGFVVHLTKPVSMQALDAAIAALTPEVMQS